MMTVKQEKPSDLFPNTDFDELTEFVKNSIFKGQNIDLRPHERGLKENDVFETCKNHNLAVNAKFINIVRKKQFLEHLNNLQNSLRSHFLDCTTEVRNTLYYESGMYMGWHTNKYSRGDRVYLIYSEKAKESHFDYYNGKEIKTITAKKGWSVNTFHCGEFERQLSHRVRAECKRVSFGFRLR